MRHFPLFLATENRRAVIVGGAESAAQKFRLIGRSSASITLMAPTLTPELKEAVAEGRASHLPAVLDPSAFEGARLAIVCTGCAALDAAAADLARRAGALVNVVDRPGLSDVIMPAIVDRDPVVVAIGTEGTAPVLARQIKTRLESMLEPNLGRYAAHLGALRPRIAHRVAPRARRAFWEWLVSGPRRMFTAGEEHQAIAQVDAALESGLPAAATPISVIGAVEPDLMTLRAVQRLQSADLILHDPDVSTGLLDLARRDAEREVLENDGPAPWTLGRTARRAIAAQSDRAEVVWLTAQPKAAMAVLRGLDAPAEAIPVGRASSPVAARAKDG